jgi:DNA topoisomerase I
VGGVSSIDPRVIDLYNDGVTIRDDLDRLGADAQFGELATQGPIEEAVLRMLREPEAERRRRAGGAQGGRGARSRSARSRSARTTRARATRVRAA